MNPGTLRGTHLRRQIATLAQMLQMNENEIHQMADFMGHTFDVHMRSYRQPELTLQTTKLAAFLMKVGEQDVTRYKGRTLQELSSDVPPVDANGFVLPRDPDHPKINFDDEDEEILTRNNEPPVSLRPDSPGMGDDLGLETTSNFDLPQNSSERTEGGGAALVGGGGAALVPYVPLVPFDLLPGGTLPHPKRRLVSTAEKATPTRSKRRPTSTAQEATPPTSKRRRHISAAQKTTSSPSKRQLAAVASRISPIIPKQRFQDVAASLREKSPPKPSRKNPWTKNELKIVKAYYGDNLMDKIRKEVVEKCFR